MRYNLPYRRQIKDELDEDYGRGDAREMILPEHRRDVANPSQPEGMRQTLAATFNDAHDVDMSSNQIETDLNGGFSSLPHSPAAEGNTFHIPPFQCLAETASAGEFRSSLPTVLSTNPYPFQAPHMPPDGAYLHSNSPALRHSSRPMGQLNLPSFPTQECAYSFESGFTYPRNMPAPCMLSATMDPSRLLPRQISMPNIQAESASESDIEMDDGGDSDRGRDRQLGNDDAAGWGYHPDTIAVGTPDFIGTKIRGDMRDAAGVRVPVVIQARFVLKKKAAKQQNFWILYRRNYFGVQGSYNLKPLPDSAPDETLYLYGNKGKPEPIQALFMCMRGVVETEKGPEIKIVVFNAKRKPLHEGKDPPPIEPQRMKPLTEGSTGFYTASTGSRQDHMNVPMNHTFHRNQFRAATQNNGARRTEQQFYHILLELKAEIIVNGVSKLHTIASNMSEPLVVRGRCPLSFKDKDKDKDRKEDGHTRDPDHKGRKVPRDGGGNRSRRGSTMPRQKEGQAKGTSRSSYNKTGGRSTRASSSLPSLTFGTGNCSTNAPVSPLSTMQTSGVVNRETIPGLDYKLLTLTGECSERDPPWLDERDSL